MTGDPAGDSPVETYLDGLLVALSGHPREIRHQLAEAEDHLREATAAGIARGLSPERAESEAVERFGPAQPLAAAEARRQHRSLTDLVTGCALSGWWLGALGAVAVGISGVLAAIGTVVWGQTFTAGRPPAAVLTASNCARWMVGTGARSCLRAATADWAGDTATFRIGLGLLGAVALASWALLRRRPRRHHASLLGTKALPAVVVDTIAVTCFGGAGLWLAGQAVDTFVVAAGRGAGQWLSAAPVALGLAAVFALRLGRSLAVNET